MKRKSEVAGTIMMYVMMGIVIVSVIMFGYKNFIKINPLVDDIKCADFAKSLHERLNAGKLHGTKDYADIDVGCNVARICFIDLYYDSSIPDTGNAIMNYIWNNNLKKNVFLLNEYGVPRYSFYVEGLRARKSKYDDTPYVCFDNDGYISMLIQGTGRYVWVSEQPTSP